MATITAPVYLWDASDTWVETTSGVRSTAYEGALQRVVPSGKIVLWGLTDYATETASALRRSPGDAGYAGAGTLSIFGSGLIAPVGRHRE